MIKKLLAFMLCGIMLFCFVSCNKETTSNISSTESTNSSQTTSELEESDNQADSNQTTSKLEENDNKFKTVFNTQNITRISFYAYYGSGIGSEVPAEHMTEITNWLGTFTIDEKYDDNNIIDGLNTNYVEIEYLDGTVIKNGLDTIMVDGIHYYMKHDKEPDCYWEILSHAKLTD